MFLQQNFRFSISFRPSMRNKSQWGWEGGGGNKKAIESFSFRPAHHFGLANTSLVWLNEGESCYVSILSIKSFRFHKLV